MLGALFQLARRLPNFRRLYLRWARQRGHAWRRALQACGSAHELGRTEPAHELGCGSEGAVWRSHRSIARARRRARDPNVTQDKDVASGDGAAEVPADPVPPPTPTGVSLAASAPRRTLMARPSRERSPRREPRPLPSDAPRAAGPQPAPSAAWPGGFAVGQCVSLRDLASRPDLCGLPAVIAGYHVDSARYAVEVISSGESILVKPSSISE